MSKKNITIIIAAIVVVGLAITGIVVSRHSSVPSSQAATSSNPQDLVAGLYPNEIKNTATAVGFTIKSAAVENNTDTVTGKVVSDHLEVTLVNTTAKPLTDFEIYYTMTDTKTQQKEGYYKKLTGFTLAAHATATIHCDNKTGDGHFSANKSSLYYTSTNAIDFNVEISTTGYAPQNITVTKAAGGAETKD
jgi:hypothetical protein